MCMTELAGLYAQRGKKGISFGDVFQNICSIFKAEGNLKGTIVRANILCE